MDGYIKNVRQDIDLRLDPVPFYTPFQIFTINRKYRSKTPMKSKKYFSWVFMDIILAISTKSLTKDITFSNHLLIVDAYYKIPKFYKMKNITTEEVMDKLDIFQARFGKVDEFGW